MHGYYEYIIQSVYFEMDGILLQMSYRSNFIFNGILLLIPTPPRFDKVYEMVRVMRKIPLQFHRHKNRLMMEIKKIYANQIGEGPSTEYHNVYDNNIKVKYYKLVFFIPFFPPIYRVYLSWCAVHVIDWVLLILENSGDEPFSPFISGKKSTETEKTYEIKWLASRIDGAKTFFA